MEDILRKSEKGTKEYHAGANRDMDYTQSKEVKALNRNGREVRDGKGRHVPIYRKKAYWFYIYQLFQPQWLWVTLRGQGCRGEDPAQGDTYHAKCAYVEKFANVTQGVASRRRKQEG